MTTGEWTAGVVTAVYTLISYLTLRAIKKQADIARDNTDVLVASERSWVAVSVGWTPGYPGMFLSDSSAEGPGHTASVRLTCKNDGKTPAWIVEIRARLEIFEPAPLKPPLERTEVVDHTIVSLAAGHEQPCDKFLICKGRQTMDNLAIIYGVVRYRTAIGPATVRETWFAYTVSSDGKRLTPHQNAEWNRNT